MKTLITPEAEAVLFSSIDDPSTLRLIGNAIQFDKTRRYRQHHVIARLHPYVKPVVYLQNGTLGLRHWVTEEKLLLFCPPENRYDMTDEFFSKRLATSKEFAIT